jgi:hypothetical protein
MEEKKRSGEDEEEVRREASTVLYAGPELPVGKGTLKCPPV